VPLAVFCLLTALRLHGLGTPSSPGGSGSACPAASTPPRCSSHRSR
jgi:hypothetical protein